MIAIYTLTSELHDAQAVGAATHEFLESLRTDYELLSTDYSSFGQHALDLIYVRTGGTEGIFKRLLPQLRKQTRRPFYLLTSGKSNSLAASMEILSYLRQQGLRGEIIHGDAEYIRRRIGVLALAGETLAKLRGSRMGVVGQPSDWLIASSADRAAVGDRLGIELVDVSMEEVTAPLLSPLGGKAQRTENPSSTDIVHKTDSIMRKTQRTENLSPQGESEGALEGAKSIYRALRMVVDRHQLQGFTLRCFDLLTAVRNTGCWALAKLNSEGIVAGCEGDVPALLSMAIGNALTGVSGFQANPASIDPVKGEMVFAHCTIPLNMVESYELDTHFESGIGVGIRGYMKPGPVTVFKVAGDLKRCFVAEGELTRNQAEPHLCRTQQVVRLADAAQTNYFLTEPIGNHHIILPGRHADVLKEVFFMQDVN